LEILYSYFVEYIMYPFSCTSSSFSNAHDSLKVNKEINRQSLEKLVYIMLMQNLKIVVASHISEVGANEKKLLDQIVCQFTQTKYWNCLWYRKLLNFTFFCLWNTDTKIKTKNWILKNSNFKKREKFIKIWMYIGSFAEPKYLIEEKHS
jgi:hypothetical protein